MGFLFPEAVEDTSEVVYVVWYRNVVEIRQRVYLGLSIFDVFLVKLVVWRKQLVGCSHYNTRTSNVTTSSFPMLSAVKNIFPHMIYRLNVGHATFLWSPASFAAYITDNISSHTG